MGRVVKEGLGPGLGRGLASVSQAHLVPLAGWGGQADSVLRSGESKHSNKT